MQRWASTPLFSTIFTIAVNAHMDEGHSNGNVKSYIRHRNLLSQNVGDPMHIKGNNAYNPRKAGRHTLTTAVHLRARSYLLRLRHQVPPALPDNPQERGSQSLVDVHLYLLPRHPSCISLINVINWAFLVALESSDPVTVQSAPMLINL